MDVFGRKKAAQELKEINAELFAVLAQVLDQSEQISVLQRELAEARKDLAVAQEQTKFLKTQRDQLLNTVPQFSTTPLHVSEEQEDAKFLGEIGLMSAKEVEDVLQHAGFSNSEIEFH